VVAVPEFAPPEIKPPDGGQVLLLVKGESRLAIAADTGEVIQDTVKAPDRAAVEQVLATLEVKEFDSKIAPWPYGSAPPSTPRERWGKITFIQPDRASGLAVFFGFSDSPPPEGGAKFVQISNGRSTLSMNAETGAIYQETTEIAAEDQEAFDRFLSAIEFVKPGE
jgi:hypothetical protein